MTSWIGVNYSTVLGMAALEPNLAPRKFPLALRCHNFKPDSLLKDKVMSTFDFRWYIQ